MKIARPGTDSSKGKNTDYHQSHANADCAGDEIESTEVLLVTMRVLSS